MHDRSSTLQTIAAELRASLTPSEAALWRHIQGSRTGAWFRRQAVIGGRFIVDFVALPEKLVVEVDGPCHTRRRSADARRDRKLARLGYRVLRLEEALVLEHPHQAVARIRAALAEQA
jgi:very-short-patch-repair endonuclease